MRDTSRKCTDEIRTCEGLQAESVQMRYKQKVEDEHEGLQAESVQMRLNMRGTTSKVYR